MNEKIAGVIAVIVVIVGGWYLLQETPVDVPSAITTNMPVIGSTTPEMIVETLTPGVTVTYTDQGFSPKSITVPLGTAVTFVNQSAGGMWVASAMHPTHTVYSGTSLSQHCPDTTNSAFDACTASAPGSSFSFTFNKEGTWKYHDHADASQAGVVIVTASATAPI